MEITVFSAFEGRNRVFPYAHSPQFIYTKVMKTPVITVKRRKWIGAALIASILAALFIFFKEPLSTALVGCLEWCRENKWGGSAVIFTAYQFFPLFFLPVTVLNLSAGFIYGPVYGILIIWSASTMSCAFTYLIGRYFLRGWVRKQEEKRPKLRALNKAVRDDGAKIIALSRFSLLIPYALLNFYYGASRISFRTYILVSMVAMLPGTVLYVYAGTFLNELGNIWNPEEGVEVQKQVFMFLGVLATFILMAYLTYRSKNILKEYEETVPQR